MSSENKSYDVIVVGAGTGGTIAARFCAKNGLNVCLIDTKPKDRIGDKICGDGVPPHIFDFLNIKAPQGDELAWVVKGGKLYAPNLEESMVIVDPRVSGFVVNRLEFGQRLLNECLDTGVQTFLDNTKALDLIYSGSTVAGVKVRLKNGEKKDIRGNLVIDASGYHSILRRKIRSPLIEKTLSNEEAVICYREIVEVDPKEQRVHDPEFISIIMDSSKSPGGIIWHFPKGEHSANIGMGILLRFKHMLKDHYQKYVFNHFITAKNYKITSSAGDVDPIRRPLWSCAENGIMFVGDSAFQVNPMDGGGIEPSMEAAYYAANAAVSAFEKGDFSLTSLWKYNHDVMTNFGAIHAALDVQRIFMQYVTPTEMDFIFKKGLLKGEEILDIVLTGEIKIGLGGLLSKGMKAISKPGLLLRFNLLRTQMNKVSKHYRNFPMEFERFEKWKQKAEGIYNKLPKKLKNKYLDTL